MTALGPCPACSSPHPHQHGNPMVACIPCGFSCTREHWNLLRRKMTTEELDRTQAARHRPECESLLYRSPDCTCDAVPLTMWLRAALAGEK